MDELKKKKFDLAEKVLSVLTNVSFGLGSAVFRVYCAKNGGFRTACRLLTALGSSISLRHFQQVRLLFTSF